MNVRYNDKTDRFEILYEGVWHESVYANIKYLTTCNFIDTVVDEWIKDSEILFTKNISNIVLTDDDINSTPHFIKFTKKILVNTGTKVSYAGDVTSVANDNSGVILQLSQDNGTTWIDLVGLIRSDTTNATKTFSHTISLNNYVGKKVMFRLMLKNNYYNVPTIVTLNNFGVS